MQDNSLFTLAECLKIADDLVGKIVISTVGKNNISEIKENSLEKILGQSIYSKLYERSDNLSIYSSDRDVLMKNIVASLGETIKSGWVSVDNKVSFGQIRTRVKVRPVKSIISNMPYFQEIVLKEIDAYIADQKLLARKKQNDHEKQRILHQQEKAHEEKTQDIRAKNAYLTKKCIELEALINEARDKNLINHSSIENKNKKMIEIKSKVNTFKYMFNNTVYDLSPQNVSKFEEAITEMHDELAVIISELEDVFQTAKMQQYNAFFSAQPNNYNNGLHPTQPNNYNNGFHPTQPKNYNNNFFPAQPNNHPFRAQQNNNPFHVQPNNNTFYTQPYNNFRSS